MKKRLLILVTIAALASCSKSKEEIAKDLIKKELAGSMNDFKSYEPVSFGTLDSTFSSYDRSLVLTDVDTSVYVVDDALRLKKEREAEEAEDNKEKAFKPEFIGYHMSHKFRGKNAVGALVLSDYNFQFDKGLTKITDSNDRQAYGEEMKQKLESLKDQLNSN